MKKILAFITALSIVMALAACGGSSDNNGGNNNGNGDDGGNFGGIFGNNPTENWDVGTAPTTNPPSIPDTSIYPTDNAGDSLGDLASYLDFGSILGGAFGAGYNFGNLSAAEKQAIVNSAKAYGVDVSFAADGSVVYAYDDGTAAAIWYPDGTWAIRDEDGNEFSYVVNPDGTWTMKGSDGTEVQLGGNWPDNEYTRQLPKPDMEIFVSVVEEDGFSVVFMNATTAQLKAYAETLKSHGFNIDVEVQEMFGYTFSASNSAGYEVSLYDMSGMNGLTMTKY